MKRKTILKAAGFFIFFMSVYGKAADLNVNVSGVATGFKDLQTINKITLGNNIPTCTMIGSASRVNLGNGVANTNGNSGVFYLSITGGVEVCVGQFSNYRVYGTNVPGIGISYNDADGASQSYGQPITNSSALKKFSHKGTALGIGAWVETRLWKYSSRADSTASGVISISGLELIQGIGAEPGDTLSFCDSYSRQISSVVVCATTLVTPRFYSSVYSGTCEFVNSTKTVQMGESAISSGDVAGYGSRWIDASFQLSCPNAYGYNSDPANTATITKNNAVTVTVQPRNGVVDANNGIIQLDGTGAQGVGIQLAWGDYGSQSATPANPVKLNTPTNANTLSSNFASGPYAIGSNPISGDGTIKMAARYIRTTGTVQPGPANSAVEILANYQ